MAMQWLDRVRVATATTGTGPMTIGAAALGFQGFSLFTVGNQAYYVIEDGSNWEVGLGTLTSATVWTRTTVIASSAGGTTPLTLSGSAIFYLSWTAAAAAPTTSYATNRVFYVRDYGAIGDGSSHPASANGFATLAALQAKYPFATALTNEMDWLGTQAAKIAAEAAPFGGIIDMGPGKFIWDQVLTPFLQNNESGSYATGKNVSLRGVAEDSTYIVFPTDISGAFASSYVLSVAERTTLSAGSNGFWSGFTMIGPQGTNTHVLAPGATSPVNVGAMAWFSGREVRNVFITGFAVGVAIVGDQSMIERVSVAFCYYTYYWDVVSTALATGDLLMNKCISSNAYVAALACAHAAQITKVTFVRCCFAQAPVLVMKETNSGSPSSPVLLYECVFDATQFENPGIAAISEDQILSTTNRVTVLANNEFRFCQFGPWTPSAHPSGTACGTAMIDCQSVSGKLKIDGIMEQYSWTPGSSGMIRLAGQQQITMSGDLDTLIANAVAAASPAINQMTSGDPGGIQYEAFLWKGEAAYIAYAYTGSAMAGYYLVFSGGQPSQSAGTTADVPFGVVMHADANHQNGMVATSGIVTVNASGTIAYGNFVRTAANGAVIAASGPTDTTSPIVGMAVGASASGKVLVKLRKFF